MKGKVDSSQVETGTANPLWYPLPCFRDNECEVNIRLFTRPPAGPPSLPRAGDSSRQRRPRILHQVSHILPGVQAGEQGRRSLAGGGGDHGALPRALTRWLSLFRDGVQADFVWVYFQDALVYYRMSIVHAQVFVRIFYKPRFFSPGAGGRCFNRKLTSARQVVDKMRSIQSCSPD